MIIPSEVLRARWNEIKKIKLGNGKYFHVSCEAYMIENPFGKHLPKVPYVASPGVTYRKPKEDNPKYQQWLKNLERKELL